jgi:hypothetical protein
MTKRVRKSYFVVFPIFLFFSLFFQIPNAFSIDTCEFVRDVSAEKFWFSDVYEGFQDIEKRGSFLIGIPNLRFFSCNRMPLHNKEDLRAKTKGYRGAIWELLEWDWSKAEASELTSEHDRNLFTLTKKRVQEGTGRELISQEVFLTWWKDNHRYSKWSNEKNRLVVDESAKGNKDPLFYGISQVTGRDFWFTFARGELSNITVVKDFAYGSRTNLDGRYTGKFKVPLDQYEDREQKERGYLDAMNVAINFFQPLGSPILNENINVIDSFIKMLQFYTNKAFDKREEWVDWWNENKESLRLSDDGQKIVVF